MVRVLAGADVLTVVEQITVSAQASKISLNAVIAAVNAMREAVDFHAAVVLVAVKQPGDITVYSQRLLPTAFTAAVNVEPRWTVGAQLVAQVSDSRSYFVSLTRQDPRSSARMQYLGNADRCVTIGHLPAAGPDLDERAVAGRHIALGVESVSFHSSTEQGSGLEVAVWGDSGSLERARHNGEDGSAPITGPGLRACAVTTRESTDRIY